MPRDKVRAAAYMKEWRKQHQEEQRAYFKEYNAKRFARNRAIIDEAKSKPCSDCGVQYPSYVMDLDHVRGDKVMAVGLMKTHSVKTLRAEIEKCEAVCSNCHRIRTYGRGQCAVPSE